MNDCYPMTADVFDVTVVKPFEATRTPCPPAGTIGQCYDLTTDWVKVRFRKPVLDTNGGEWPPVDDSPTEPDNYLFLLFHIDEVALIEE